MFLGMPVAFAIGCSAFLFYVFGPVPASIAVQRIASVDAIVPAARGAAVRVRRPPDERGRHHRRA